MRRNISHLTITSYQGIEQLVLEGIGKINVLCGKNNSGKSTILRAINLVNSPEDKVVDLKFSNIDEEFILSTMIEHKESNSPNIVQHIEKKIEKIIEEHFYKFLKLKGASLSEKEVPSISQKFREYVNLNFTDSLQEADKNLIIGYLYSWFNNYTASYIYSTRKVIHETPFMYREEILLTGSDLLNYIFRLKNQPYGSDDYDKFKALKEAFKDISLGCSFDLNLRENMVELKFSDNEIDWFLANSCGQGLYELLYILSNILLVRKNIYLIEEPENHLHPDIQRKLLYYLYSLDESYQFFISTHSNVFLDLTFVDKVFHVSKGFKIQIKDDTSKAQILQDIGYSVSDNLIADLILLIEGPTDKPVLEEFLNKLGLLGNFNLKIWALGGDIMHHHDLSVFTEVYKVIALIDNDPKSQKIRNRFIKKCKELNIPITRLERYSIENYFSISALRKVFKNQFPDELTSILPDQKLEEQIGMNCKKNNRKIVKEMNIEEIADTDLYDFLMEVQDILLDKKAIQQ